MFFYFLVFFEFILLVLSKKKKFHKNESSSSSSSDDSQELRRNKLDPVIKTINRILKKQPVQERPEIDLDEKKDEKVPLRLKFYKKVSE